MKFYTLLSPEDFQNLARDIVQIKEDIILESFSPGKDDGIDFRGTVNNKTLIVQVKSTKNYNTLKNQLKNEELVKVKRLNPERYVLVIALSLTPSKKKEIFQIFKDFLESEEDIITGEDIENYLNIKKFYSIRTYYMQKALSTLIGTYSYKLIDNHPFINCKALFQDIEYLKTLFIRTNCFDKILNHTKDNNIIILTGEPGVGKTTNAKMLINYLLDKEKFDEVIELKNCSEFSKYYDYRKKQIFFCDDFWGSSFLFHQFPSNEDQELYNIFNILHRNNNSYLILTTREYVLKQGLRFYHSQENKDINTRIYHANSDLSNFEKTKILVSHLLNSSLDYSIIRNLLNYTNRIIENSNYSPRTISYYIEQHQDDSIDFNHFFKNLLDYLDHPNSYFENIFFKLSEGARIIAYIIAISSPPISLNKLENTFFNMATKISNQSIKPSFFVQYLKELENTFTIYHPRDKSIDFKNPSIHDFINDLFISEFLNYKDYFIQGINYFDQYLNLFDSDNLILSEEDVSILITRLMKDFYSITFAGDSFYDIGIYSDIDNTFSWYSKKIWHSVRIYRRYPVNDFLSFLEKKTLDLLHLYDRKIHSYENSNFIEFPELFRVLENVGCNFDYQSISKLYLNNCCYLFEFKYIEFGSNKFQQACKKNFNLMKDTFIDELSIRLEEELDLLAEDGISFQYDLTIDDLPSILNFFDIPCTKEIKKILKEYAPDYSPKKQMNKTSNDNHNHNSISSKSTEEKKIDKYLSQITDSLYKKDYLNKRKFNDFVNQQDFDSKEKNKIKKAYNQEYTIFALPNEICSTYLSFLFDYYHTTKDIDLSWNLFPKLVQYIISQVPTISEDFLYKYAHYKSTNENILLSKKHLIKHFEISENSLDELIRLGVLDIHYNLVGFSDVLFEMYLSTMYISRQKNINYCTYEKYFLSKTIYSSYDYIMFEFFDTKNFNKYFLQTIFQNIINDDISSFRKNICNIEIASFPEFGGYTILSSDFYSFYDDFLFNFFGVSARSLIIELIENSNWIKQYSGIDKPIHIVDFLTDTNNHQTDDYAELIDLCDTYYSLAKDVYSRLINLNDNEKFEVKFENGEIIF